MPGTGLVQFMRPSLLMRRRPDQMILPPALHLREGEIDLLQAFDHQMLKRLSLSLRHKLPEKMKLPALIPLFS